MADDKDIIKVSPSSSQLQVDAAKEAVTSSSQGLDYYDSKRNGNVDTEISFLKDRWTTEGGQEAVKRMEAVAAELNTAMDSIRDSANDVRTAGAAVSVEYEKVYI